MAIVVVARPRLWFDTFAADRIGFVAIDRGRFDFGADFRPLKHKPARAH